MSLIESSTASPLAGALALDDDKEEEAEVQEPEPQHEAKPNPRDGTRLQNLIDQIEDINLARYLDQHELDRIGMLCVEEYRIDEQSREGWVDKAEKAMKMAVQEAAEKAFPWPNASNFIFPLITQATIEFAARTYPAIVQNRNVVKGIVWGSDNGTPLTKDGTPDGEPITAPNAQGQPQIQWKIAPGEKQQRAVRIGEHMSWQLLKDMPEWEPQTDQMLHQIPVVGGAVRKTYNDEIEEKPRSLFVSLLNLVWNYHAPSFETAPRHSEKVLLYPYQIADLERTCEDDCDYEKDGGMFLPVNYYPGGGSDETFNGQPISNDNNDEDAPQLFIEQHRRLDLDDDGYDEPYIVTVHLRSSRVVRIVARYEEDGIKANKKGTRIYKIEPEFMYTLYRFLPNIDGGSYPMGFGQLLRPLNEGINTSLNQMFDAGTLANAGGGFISDQLGLPSGQTLFQVGKYTRVTTKGQAIKDAVYPLPFQGANATLFQVLGLLITASKEMAGIGNILTGDASIANAPPTTVLALIEQGLKFYTAIIKRIFLSEKSEFDKLYKLNQRNITKKVEYNVGDQVKIVEADDYALGGGVEPIADPSMTTDMQKLGRAQVAMAVKDEPDVNRRKIIENFLDAASIERPEDFMNQPDPAAAQMQQTMQQLAIAQAQAELGSERAKELKDQTQAFLNMSLARKNANAQQEAFIDAQLDYLRLHIEALNTTVKAAAVDHKFHDTRMRSATAEAQRVAEDARHAREMALEGMQASPAAQGLPTPGPQGPFPVEPGPAGAAITPGTAATGPASGSQTPAPPDVAGAPMPGLPGRAGGGPVEPGQPYTVGERGPETFVPDQPGTIVPAQQGGDEGTKLLQKAQKDYPYISQYNPVVTVNPGGGEGYAETWPIGEEGDKDSPRPASIPIDRHGVEVYGSKFGPAGVAAEFLHLDPVANKARAQLLGTLTPEQVETLKHESLDYSSTLKRHGSEARAMQNAVDSALRGYTVGQWPKEANDRMNYTPKQRQILDNLHHYMTTGREHE